MNPSALGSLNPSLLAVRAARAGSPAPLRELTAGLARGDDAAWSHFHADYGPQIFRQLLAATRGDHDLASEALQQTYLRVARHARPCDSEPMFLGWLRVVARTALSDCRRRRMSFWQMLNRRRDDPSEAGSGDAPHEADEQLQTALDAALASLSEADRALLAAKYFAGTSMRDIAERLNISLKAVESRLTRARAELRLTLLAALARHD